jgi:hypothetical protein
MLFSPTWSKGIRAYCVVTFSLCLYARYSHRDKRVAIWPESKTCDPWILKMTWRLHGLWQAKRHLRVIPRNAACSMLQLASASKSRLQQVHALKCTASWANQARKNFERLCVPHEDCAVLAGLARRCDNSIAPHRKTGHSVGVPRKDPLCARFHVEDDNASSCRVHDFACAVEAQIATPIVPTVAVHKFELKLFMRQRAPNFARVAKNFWREGRFTPWRHDSEDVVVLVLCVVAPSISAPL